MRTPIALCLGLVLVAPAGAATFTSAEMGLTFLHPDNWKVTTKKGDTRVNIPLDGDSAQLLIFARSYNADIELWMNVEKNIALQQKQTIDGQTQEEIMGVPLLLTRVKYTLKGRAMMALSGLVYSATPRKMLFRLIAPESSFEEAERLWRTALQTIKTLDGKLPKAEDPARVVTPEDVKEAKEGPTKITVIKPEGKKQGKFKKGVVAVETQTAGRKVQLCLPAGWTGELQADGCIQLRHAGLASALKIVVQSSLDSEEPAKALAKAAAASLAAFSSVTMREDPKQKVNTAGATISVVWRWGAGASGDLVSCDAVGVSADNYWLLSYQGAMPQPGSADGKLLGALFETMSVELAP
jgi:hypothetical protein